MNKIVKTAMISIGAVLLTVGANLLSEKKTEMTIDKLIDKKLEERKYADVSLEEKIES